MTRFIQLPTAPPPGLDESFGPWTKENLFHWVIRLFFLSDSANAPRPGVLAQSLAILSEDGSILGGAINEPLSHGAGDSSPDAFRDAVLSVFLPILTLLMEQDAEAVAALCGRYPDFENALHHGLAGHFALVARADQLPVEEAFELVAASAEHYRQLGFSYVLTSATNQWTGAAFTALGGVPVHFEPYLGRQRVAASPVPIDTVSSPSGYLSAKDSGSMIFVLRLA
jgi:hypothetical protein